MTQTSAWNSVKEPHHHNNTKCGPGSEIPPHNRTSGTGGETALSRLRKTQQRGQVI